MTVKLIAKVHVPSLSLTSHVTISLVNIYIFAIVILVAPVTTAKVMIVIINLTIGKDSRYGFDYIDGIIDVSILMAFFFVVSIVMF